MATQAGKSVPCPACGKKLKGLVPGKRFQCPGCRASFTAPGPALPTAAVLSPDPADSGAEPVFRFEDLPPEPRRHSLAPWLIGGGTIAVLAIASLVALSMDSGDGTPPRDGERIAVRDKEKGDRGKEKEQLDEPKPPETAPPDESPTVKRPPVEPPREKTPEEQPPVQKPPAKPPVQRPPDNPPVKPPEQKPLPPPEPPSRLVHTLRGHTEFIHCVAVTPDGQWIVTGGGGKAVDGLLKTGTDFALRVWDLKTGSEVGKLSGHADNVACVAVSPDSSRVASGSQDGKVFLWDLKARRKEKELPGHPGGTTAVAFSPRGSYLASAGIDGVVRVWDVRGSRDRGSGELLRTLRGHTESLLTVLFTPDGKYLLSGGFDKTIRLWDVQTGKEVRVFRGHAEPVWALALSPDGKRLLSGSGWAKGPDPGLRLWDLEGKQLAHLPTPGDPVRGICFGPDGTHAVCSSEEGFLYLWDLEKRKIVRRDEAHQGYATGVALTPDGRRAVTAGLDRLVKVWRLPEPGPLAVRVEAGEVKITKETPVVDRPPDPTPANPKGLLRRFAKHTELVRAVAVTRDGRLALSGGGGVIADGKVNKGVDYSLLLWEVDSGDVRSRLRGHTANVTSIAMLPDGGAPARLGRALSASNNGELILWNLETGQQVRPLRFSGPGTLGGIACVAVSRDGRFALTGGAQLVLWDLKTFQNFKPFTGQPAWVHAVAFSPDGNVLAGDEFGAVILRSGTNGRQLRRFKGHSEIVWSVAFSPDGKYLAAGGGGRLDAQQNLYVPGEDNTVRIWEAATGKEVRVLKSHGGEVHSVAFSPHGKRVLSCGRDGTVSLWDVNSGKETAVLRGHTLFAEQVVFLPDGRRALSASFDRTVCLWELPE
ncbi:MAG: hypothetical protein HYS12_10715 [Planctomycetes bacterium]|nr:hypothetical protein [Planctomycetota bacterium]